MLAVGWSFQFYASLGSIQFIKVLGLFVGVRVFVLWFAWGVFCVCLVVVGFVCFWGGGLFFVFFFVFSSCSLLYQEITCGHIIYFSQFLEALDIFPNLRGFIVPNCSGIDDSDAPLSLHSRSSLEVDSQFLQSFIRILIFFKFKMYLQLVKGIRLRTSEA